MKPHRLPRSGSSAFALLLAIAVLLSAAACDDLDDALTLTPEELAERIRANTPTELPPVTTEGLNTMGAYIHTDTGRVLFVASGVDRPEVAMAESLDCRAFENYRYESNGYISATGTYCRRPEIGDDRLLSVIFGHIAQDSTIMYVNYSKDRSDIGRVYTLTSESTAEHEILRYDESSRIFSGTFSGRLVNRAPPYDTIEVTDGRFDVTYGVTP